MATEIVRCPIVSGRNPDDPASQAGQAWKDCMNELITVEGVQRLYWGHEVENPDIIRLFVDWDSVEAHEKYQKSSDYEPFTTRLGSVLDFNKINVYHAHLQPHPPVAALSDTSTGTTEIINIYFPTSYSSSDQDDFVSGVKSLISAIESNAKTYRGSAGGWVKEELDIPGSDGEKGKVYAALIGWDSVQAHMDFRETQAFKDNIHHLRGAKDLKNVEVVHSSCVLITKGGGVGDGADESVQGEVLNPQQGGKQSVKTRADGTTTKNDGGTTNAVKKERQGR